MGKLEAAAFDAVNAVSGAVSELGDECERLRDENKRLRATLAPFADAYEAGREITSSDMFAAHAVMREDGRFDVV